MSRNAKAWKFKRALLQKEKPCQAKTLRDISSFRVFYLMQLKPQKETKVIFNSGIRLHHTKTENNIIISYILCFKLFVQFYNSLLSRYICQLGAQEPGDWSCWPQTQVAKEHPTSQPYPQPSHEPPSATPSPSPSTRHTKPEALWK